MGLNFWPGGHSHLEDPWLKVYPPMQEQVFMVTSKGLSAGHSQIFVFGDTTRGAKHSQV